MPREGLPSGSQENRGNEKEEAQKRALIPLLILGKTYEAMGLIDRLNISSDVIQSSEVQEAAKKGMVSKLALGQAEAASDVLKMYDIPPEVLQGPEVQQAAAEGISKWLLQQDVPKALKIKERFAVPEEFFNSAVTDAMAKALFAQENERFNKLKDGLQSSDQIVQDAAKIAMLKYLDGEDLGRALRIKDDFKISQKVIKSPEVQGVVVKNMTEQLSSGKVKNAKWIKEKFSVSEKAIQSAEVQEAIKKAIVEIFSYSYTSISKELLDLKKEFNFPDSVIESPEIQKAIKKGALNYLSQGNLNRFLDFKKEFSLSKDYIQSPEVHDAGIKGMASCLFSGDLDKAQKIKEKLKLSEEMFLSAVKETMIKHIDYSVEGGVNSILQLKEKFNIPNDVIQDVAKIGIVNRINAKEMNRALVIIEKLTVSDEVVQSPEIQNPIQQVMLERIQHHDSRGFSRALEIIKEFRVSQEFIQTAEVQDLAKRGFIHNLSHDIDLALKIITGFNIREEIIKSFEVQEEIKRVFLNNLSRDINLALKIKEALNISEEFIHSPEIQEIAKTKIIMNLSRGGFGYMSKAQEIKSGLNVSDEVMRDAAMDAVIQIFSTNGDINAAIDIKKTFNIPNQQVKEYLIQSVKLNKLAFGKIPDLAPTKEFFTENILGPSWKYVDTLTLGENVLMKKKLAEEQGLDLDKIDQLEIVYEPQTERDYEYIFENIKGLEGSVWTQEGHEIKKAFEDGSIYFGYKKMFQFVGGKSHHDKLFAFEKIIKMAQKSGLKPEQFYANILLQVKHDTSNYGEESNIDSYQRLNNIADTVSDIDILGKLKKAKEYDISRIRDLVDQIEKPEDIFTNWKSLKNFTDLVELLNKSVILEQLKGLSGEGKEKLKSYIEHLAFHPNINTQSVIKFWQKPGEFLGVGDDHSSKVHELKKPSNYVDIPYMDLKPGDLRDALVEGSLDRIQAWRPLEIEYKIPQGEFGTLSFLDQVKRALGSRSEKIAGIAKDPGVLFKKLNDLCKKEKLNLLGILKGEVEIPEEIKEGFQEALYNEEYGLVLPSKEYRVKIGLKSDPEVVVAGNDTACCMPFGSGKNNVYTYNPVCGQLVVQRKTKDGWRTIAQSVITKNKDIKKNVASIIQAVESNGGASLHETFSEDVLISDKDIMTCDNIEVSHNFKDRSDLELLYKDFFTEYAEHFGEAENLDTSRLIIGTGHTDLSVGQSIDNTFVPTAPMGYSDNTGRSANMIDLAKSNKFNLQKKLRIERIQEIEKMESEIPGITNFTYADTLAAAYIEGKAYEDNPSLKEYLHNIENGLIAKDILNSHFNLPDMSLKYEDNNKKVQGYLLAYEGQDESDENIIYVADLAANTESKLAGGRLIKAFADRYKKMYIDKNKFTPIMVDARDKTSYGLITKQLEAIGKDVGVKFELKEINSYKKGADRMHTVIIRPIQKKAV